MTAKIIDGKAIAAALRKEVAAKVAWIYEHYEVKPGLAVVRVGDDPASEIYVRNKHKAALEVGMESLEFHLPSGISEKDLVAHMMELNTDPKIHGILVQLPLPSHINEQVVIEAVTPKKDVDGFHIENVGSHAVGNKGNAMVPCTPRGCLKLINSVLGEDLSGKHAVVIGRSNIVGKPMQRLLTDEHCTVTLAHSRTQNIEAIAKLADILVVAIGKPGVVKEDWVKQGAVVIDVGINRLKGGTIVGDVDFEAVKRVAGAITPVPGGVGPMTIACLLENTLTAFCRQKGISY